MSQLKLVSANFVKNEAHCIELMLDSVQPFVDDSYILVDKDTTDNTADICKSRGCKVEYFEFENFAKVWNTLLSWVNSATDWTIFIAPDETIDAEFGNFLRPAIEKMHTKTTDGMWFRRKHWVDLEKTKEYTAQNWYPDWQLRLIRNDYPRIHLVNYVHEWPKGIRKTIRTKMDIHHFNMYWKPRLNYNFEKMNTLYAKLQKLQKEDGGGNIWP